MFLTGFAEAWACPHRTLPLGVSVHHILFFLQTKPLHWIHRWTNLLFSHTSHVAFPFSNNKRKMFPSLTKTATDYCPSYFQRSSWHFSLCWDIFNFIHLYCWSSLFAAVYSLLFPWFYDCNGSKCYGEAAVFSVADSIYLTFYFLSFVNIWRVPMANYMRVCRRWGLGGGLYFVLEGNNKTFQLAFNLWPLYSLVQ